jgi:hypothetical protein
MIEGDPLFVDSKETKIVVDLLTLNPARRVYRFLVGLMRRDELTQRLLKS